MDGRLHGGAPVEHQLRMGVGEIIQGREVRTVKLDPERAPLVRMAFELYATGEYTLRDLRDELYDRGLRSKPHGDRPSKKVEVSKLSQLLRDRYYIGFVQLKGEEYQGRHEPLISNELFEQVQDMIEARAAANERRRVHHHYLKGSLFCGHCKRRRGVKRRMIIQYTAKQDGSGYTYFFCRNKQQSDCPVPHINVTYLEEAVEAHYARVKFSPGFVAEMREYITEIIAEEKTSIRLLHEQLTKELAALDERKARLLDAVEDGTLPRETVRQRMADLQGHRTRLRERQGRTNEDLAAAARLIEVGLTLLEDPQALYLRCDDRQRRMLNQAIFQALYVEENHYDPNGAVVTGHTLREPFRSLHALQNTQEQAATEERAATTEQAGEADSGITGEMEPPVEANNRSPRLADLLPQNDDRVPPLARRNPAFDALDVLLGGNRWVNGSSSASLAPLGTHQYKWKRQLAVLERLLTKLPDLTVPVLRRQEGRAPGRNAKQVRGERAEEVVAAYLAGASVYEVAEHFGIVRQTVSKTLKRRGVKLRRNGLSPEQIDEAAWLYEDGWSLAKVGAHLGVSPDTVRLRLLGRGVQMRDHYQR